MGVSATGQVLATVLSEGRWSLQVMSASSGGADAHPVDTAGAFTNFSWTHDGQLIHDKDNGLQWLNLESKAKGMFSTQPDAIDGDPWECSDGRYLIFLHGVDVGKAGQSVWRADASGGNLKQISQGPRDNFPVCAPDSKSAYYMNGDNKVVQVSIDGGAERKVSDVALDGFFAVSPDGKTIAFPMIDHAAGHELKLALVASDSEQVQKTLEFQRPRATNLLQFSRDGKSLVYAVRENGVDNLWQQPIDGTAGKPLTSFKSEHIWDFHWSPDGTKLAMVRGHTDADVVLIRDMQQ